MRVGAIDIGSNSIRLLVADVLGPGAIATLARAGEVCRLGRGLDRTGRIDLELAERAGTLALDFVRRARALGASHLVIGATAAMRSASNGREVADIVGRRAGVAVRILTGEEEARLVYQSVVLGLGGAARRSSCVVFDLGGGSTEVVSGVGEQPGRWASLPLGAVSLTERHLHSDPPLPHEVETLRREVRDVLMHHCASMPSRTPLLAGVGGTVSVLASLDRAIPTYDPVLLEGWTIRTEDLFSLVDRLVRSSQAERRSWAVVGEGRADIVVAGALVVSLIVERFPSLGLVCSTQGLRYGLARLAAEEAGLGRAAAS
jgi:exopolyphosphatase/guanosine-5'-triphosphate,3'-diphosphate pyrophosphatase